MAELGSGNGTDYPSALDTDNTLEVDGSTLVRADVPNDLGAAIVAIENELGTNPSGTVADVKSYLQIEHNTNGTHDTSKVVMIAGSQTITGEKLFSETLRTTKGSDVASATTLSLGAGNYFDITGTTTVTGITSIGIGTQIKLHFDGALQLTHHATNFFLIGGANITTVAGDEAEFVEYDTGKWRMVSYSSVYAAKIRDDSITSSKINTGAVVSDGLATASTYGSQSVASTTWTPAAGWYTFAVEVTSGNWKMEVATGGGWSSSTVSTGGGGGAFFTDGSDVRFSTSSGTSVFHYRKLD